MKPADLDVAVPGTGAEREVFASGPGDLLDAITEHIEEHGDCERLHMERFQPVLGSPRG
jgi:ferredoxin-NADP reductase